MLLGEYTTLLGGKSLAYPLDVFAATWAKGSQVDQDLSQFYTYLRQNLKLSQVLDLPIMLKDLESGWYLKSNIPRGYGCGSSGSVVAAVYDRYKRGADLPVLETKSVLADMESFFHHRSSGTDPLVSYLNKALQLGEQSCKMVGSSLVEIPFNLALLDSGISRNTAELVGAFKSRMEMEPEYGNEVTALKELANRAIDSVVDVDGFAFDHWKRISSLEFSIFHKFIPDHIAELWKSGRESDQFYMKLCGAGGGGFFLLGCDQPIDKAAFDIPIILIN